MIDSGEGEFAPMFEHPAAESTEAGSVERNVAVSDDTGLEQEVRRLRAELEREKELRVAAEALAAERATALADAAQELMSRSRRRSRRSSSRRHLQGNWLR
jgi:hypothetical protein